MANKVITIGGGTVQKYDPGYTYLDLDINSESTPRNGFKIKSLQDVHAVQQSLHNIFSWLLGERVINPEFGSKLRYMLYEGITKYNEEQIVAEIKSSVSKWEPRAVITDVINMSTISDTEDNTITLDIKYYIKGLSDKTYDNVYVFNKNS